jgi:hypothetical protein
VIHACRAGRERARVDELRRRSIRSIAKRAAEQDHDLRDIGCGLARRRRRTTLRDRAARSIRARDPG